MRSAEDKDGKHDEVKRAPAAITSLSAASRCASRPPSDPSVQSPLLGTRSEMTGFSRFYSPSFSIISSVTSKLLGFRNTRQRFLRVLIRMNDRRDCQKRHGQKD